MDEHAVHYYDDDDAFVVLVGDHLTEGVEAGEYVVAIASSAHLSALERIVGAHLDAASVRSHGRLVLLDARETLELFMVDGSPDPVRFRTHVGRLITEAAQEGMPVRAFGEMVALLWDEGNVAGAIELECLWNELLEHQRFTLLCGYPTTALTGVSLRDVQAVCDLHSALVPPSSYGSTKPEEPADDHTGMRSEVFVPVAQAVRATRRFVFGVLDAWGLTELQWEAALIVSELANNAVRHGASPFRVLVSRVGDGVRIGIHDIAPGQPLQRSAAAEDLDGRGMAIIGALSTGWGCERLSDGKFTWADLAAAPTG